jgi:alpha-glucosidase (family GH31 glycosyl hydrolase)
MYTLCHEASVTGVPAVRALILEYPDDPVVQGTRTQYQFLLGPGLLVAPVYADTSIRDSIYLPRGQWYDFWNDSVINGPVVLNGYPAPLEKLPLFVKAGSILPMYPSMNYDGERPADTITLDLYPGENGAFEMVEDEGSDRSYRKGEYSRTLFRFNYSTEKKRITDISIGASIGNYHGKLPERAWLIRVHSSEMPAKVTINGKQTDKQKIFRSGPSVITLQTGYLSTAQTYKIDFQY